MDNKKARMAVTLAVLAVFTALIAVMSASQAQAAQSQSAQEKTYPVRVYFSTFRDTDPAHVSAVSRTSPTSDVFTFALQLLIAGPTTFERDRGYYSELNSILTGPSDCSAMFPTGGPDLTVKLNYRGQAPERGTATVKFCRDTQSPGELTDARIIAQITATGKQFSAVKRVVILTKDGHCFGDLSGQDHCLQ